MHNYVPEKLAKKPPTSLKKQTVSVVGARGYTGLELARILLRHPLVNFTHAFATAAFRLSDDLLDSRAQAVQCLPESELFQNLTDVVFFGNSATVSMKLVPALLKENKLVIDFKWSFSTKKE